MTVIEKTIINRSELYTVKAVSKLMGCTKLTVFNWTKQEVNPLRVNGRFGQLLVISGSDLITFIINSKRFEKYPLLFDFVD